MISPAALLAPLVVLALGGFPFRLESERGWTAVTIRSFLLGTVVLHLVLDLQSLVGIPWNGPALVAVALAIAVVWAHRTGRRIPELAPPRPTPADAAAALVVGTFGVLALRFDSVGADYFLHWLVKARRFAATGGFDAEFLTLASSWLYLPEYPCAWVDLLALPYLLGGRQDLAGPLLFSVGIFALLYAGARSILRAAGAEPLLREISLVLFLLALGRYAIGTSLGGLADWMLALALLAAVPALLAPDRPGARRELALSAAAAAATKAEGVLMAAALLAVHYAPPLARAIRERAARSTLVRDLAATVGLLAAVTLPWFWRTRIYELGSEGLIAGDYRLARAGEAAAAMLDKVLWNAPSAARWPLLLLLVPLLLLRRRTRGFATVVLLLLAADVVIYSGGSIEVRLWVFTSFDRLAFQLLPAVMVVLATTVVAGSVRVGARREP